MARNSEPLQKHTMNLRSGDMDKLRSLFPGMEPSVVARQIISRFIDKTLAKSGKPSPLPSIDE